MTEHVERSYWPIRWQASVLTAVGVLALLLAAIGLYGVIAYGVARRTQEIGVRMALRTGRLDIFRDVVGQALSIALIGVAVGEVLAVMLIRLLGSLQGDIRPPGLGLYVGTRMIWIAVAVLAACAPAARASRVNPLAALRYECRPDAPLPSDDAA